MAGTGDGVALPLPCVAAAVGRPQTGQCQRPQRAVLVQNCPAILDAQNVVGGAQQLTRTGPKRLRRGGAGGGKGLPFGQRRPQRFVQSAPAQKTCGFQQPGRIGSLSAEGQRVTAQRGEQPHPRRRKLLRRGAGVGRGQRNDHVRPRLQRGTHPHRFRIQRQAAPLHRPGAHADGDGLRPLPAQKRQLCPVAVVERVVFRNDTRKIHKNL